QQRRVHLVRPEDRRVLDEPHGRLPQRAAQTALRLLVLEHAAHAGLPADAAVRADHVRYGCTGLGGAEDVRLRDEVRDLVTAPGMALHADAVLIDEAARDETEHAGHDGLE